MYCVHAEEILLMTVGKVSNFKLDQDLHQDPVDTVTVQAEIFAPSSTSVDEPSSDQLEISTSSRNMSDGVESKRNVPPIPSFRPTHIKTSTPRVGDLCKSPRRGGGPRPRAKAWRSEKTKKQNKKTVYLSFFRISYKP